MKKFLSFIFLGLALAATSCSDEVVVNENIPESDMFTNVYIPQALPDEATVAKGILVLDSVQSIVVSACYGGVSLPKQDVKVVFEISEELVYQYNQANGTNYNILPVDCYSIASKECLIPAGKSGSNLIKIEISPMNHIEVSQEYLLPVRIASVSDNVRVSSKYNVVYFLIQGAYAPGRVPRDQLSVTLTDTTAANIFFTRGQDLFQRTPAGTVYVFEAADDGTYLAGRQLGADGAFAAYDQMGYYANSKGSGPDAFWGVATALGCNIYGIAFDDSYNLTPMATQFGTGFSSRKMIPCGSWWYTIYTGSDPTGALEAWGDFKLSAGLGLEGYINPVYSGSNLLSYKHIMPFQCASLIAVDSNGDMWNLPLSNGLLTGTPAKIGAGWDTYKFIVAADNNLLCMDYDGVWWRYNKFGVDKYWPIK